MNKLENKLYVSIVMCVDNYTLYDGYHEVIGQEYAAKSCYQHTLEFTKGFAKFLLETQYDAHYISLSMDELIEEYIKKL